MSGNGQIILPALTQERLGKLMERCDVLSDQVNYLLRELYKATGGKHGSFIRNPKLAIDTRAAIELEAKGKKQVKVTVATPEFTREQIKRLDSEKNK